MLDIKLNSKASTIIIGLLIFFVPFFTYLSPENLRQLSKSDILEILLSLIIILIVIFISSFSLEVIVKRLFKKKIILFPLLCFAFYLNFLYTPYSEALQEYLYPTMGQIKDLGGFIAFELFCLIIVALGAKFYAFSSRLILVFSSIMLISSFIPLVGALTEYIGKDSSISFEIESTTLDQDAVLKKRNIYYVILDAMMDVDRASELKIITKQDTLDNLSRKGLKYIDKSMSTYNRTGMTVASIMHLDYHFTPDSPKFVDTSHFFPHMMYKHGNEVELSSYLRKAKSSFYWAGNSAKGAAHSICLPSTRWSCVNSEADFSSRHSFKFYLSTPFAGIWQRLFPKSIEGWNAIDMFWQYTKNNGTPKTPFFAFIHHLSPHGPYFVTDECEPAYFRKNFTGYTASYRCALKTVQIFMEKINSTDPDAIVIFQGDHASNGLDLKMTLKEKHQFRGRIFNAIKAPEICFDKFGLPKTNVNTIRFALNCAYGFKLPYREEVHYRSYYERDPEWGTVIERKIYE